MRILAFTCALSVGLMSAALCSHAQSIKITPAMGAESPADTTGEEDTETEQGKRAKTDELFFEALKARQHDDDKQAESLLQEFLGKRPEVAAAYYELARVYTDQKRIDLAITNIKKAMSLEAGNKWYKEAFATILIASGNYVGAADAYSQLAKAEQQDDEYPVLAAEYYERAGKEQEAINHLDMALQRNVGDEDLMIHKMQLLLNMNQPDKAAGVLQQMITNDPKNGKYYKLLGELYDNNKMPAKAAALYEQAQKKMPNDPSIQLGMATHYLRTGDTVQYKAYLKKAVTNTGIGTEFQLELLKAYIQSMPDEATALAEALPLIAKLVEQEPTDALILEYLGEALEGNNMTDSAIVIYKKSLAIKPSNFAVWGRLLGSYQGKQYADSLIKYSEKAMRLFPNQAITHFYNGIGYVNKENYPAAIKAINRAIDLQPETEKDALAQMYSTLGDVYYTNKQYTLSDETFDKALAIDPINATVLNNYSYYLSERGIKLDDAERMSKKSLDLRPDEANFLDTYGWILYKKGDFEKAKVQILKAIEAAKGAGDATYYGHLGDIFYKLNDKAKAMDAWKKAKEKGSDDKNLDKKISEGKLYE